MRFIIIGVGAVGGTVAARLALAGHEVLAVARGAHGEAIAARGLHLDAPDGSHRVRLPVAGQVGDVAFAPDDVVVLGVKSQDTAAALADLRLVAPAEMPIACLQNGVANERRALRLFPHVYGVCVMLPADHLHPGTVRAYTAPVSGLLDVGCYPAGTDGTSNAIAAAFATSTFDSVARPDIMRWKYRKLVMNLGNALEALTGRLDRGSELMERLRAEGEAVLAAAGIDVVTVAEDAARRGDLLALQPVGGARRHGGSTRQSLQRGTAVETDDLTGEIVLLGRLHGVPTPANELLQREMAAAAAAGRPPGTLSEAALLDRLTDC